MHHLVWLWLLLVLCRVTHNSQTAARKANGSACQMTQTTSLPAFGAQLPQRQQQQRRQQQQV
jgi:hypothetical protein